MTSTPLPDLAPARRPSSWALALLCSACVAPAPPQPPKEAPALGAAVVRLLDGDARVERPVDPASIAAEPLVSLDDLSLELAGCARAARAWRCPPSSPAGFHGPTSGERAFAAFDVAGGTGARWSMETVTDASPCADVEWAEMDVPAAEVELGGGLWLSHVSALHRPHRARRGVTRRSGEVQLGQRTRSIVLALTATAGCALEVRAIDFERVSRIAEEPVQSGYLLRGHEGDGRPDQVARRAWHAPGGTRIEAGVLVPKGARLELDLAPAAAGTALVVVTLESAGRTHELIRRALDGGARRAFVPQRIDLSAFAGAEASVVFSVRGEGAAWIAEPRLVRPRAPSEPPPILWIAVDTLRADRAPCGDGGATPTIDALEADGTCFAAALSPSNWTVPAFASMFVGQSPSQHRVWHWDHRLGEVHETLTERLAQAGWSTRGIVYKSPLREIGLEQGFDSYLGGIWHRGITARTTVDAALEWLARHGDERFFLFLHFNDPHQPFNQPREGLERRDREWLERAGLAWPLRRISTLRCEGCGEPSEGFTEEFRDRARRLYDGEVAYLDGELERLMHGLRAQGILDDALVVFVSDHGEALWDRGNQHFGHGNNLFSEEVVHVPFVIRPPLGEDVERGQLVSGPVSSGSLGATVLAMVGEEEPFGRFPSLADVVRAGQPPPREAVLSEDGWGLDFAIWSQTQRLVYEPELRYGDEALAVVAVQRLISDRPGRYVIGAPEGEDVGPRAETWRLNRRSVRRLACDATVGGVTWRSQLDAQALEAPGPHFVVTACSPLDEAAFALDGETLRGLRAMGYVR